MRDKLSEAVKEFDAILKPDGRIIYLGTPQNQESLYNKLPDRGYKVSIWPARYPNPEQMVGYGSKIAPLIGNALAIDATIVGEPTDPNRFSDFDLLEREASYGRSGFALQFMLDTRLSDAERYPLKVSDLIIMDIPTQEAPEKVSWSSDSQYIVEELPNVAFNGDHYHKPMFMSSEFVEYTGSVMSIDPSGRGKDETGYAVVKMLNGYYTSADAVASLVGTQRKHCRNLQSSQRKNRSMKLLLSQILVMGCLTSCLCLC
jgi:hypothetical protein